MVRRLRLTLIESRTRTLPRTVSRLMQLVISMMTINPTVPNARRGLPDTKYDSSGKGLCILLLSMMEELVEEPATTKWKCIINQVVKAFNLT